MKKLTIIFSLVLSLALIAENANAQTGFEKGAKFVNIGTGFAGYGWDWDPGWDGNRFVIPIMASLELGVHEYISVGGYVGFAGWRDRDFGYYYRTNVGAKIAVQLLPIFQADIDPALDVYVGGYSGLEFDSRWGKNLLLRYRLTPTVGVRYMLANNLGIYAEFGGIYTYLNGGISLKF